MHSRRPLHTLAASALIMLLTLSACSSGGGRHHAGGRGPGEGGGGARSPGEMFTLALNLKASGNCRKAEAPLKRLAAFGGGFEIAQFHLADCLLWRAEHASPAEEQLLTSQALHWLELSARSDEPLSQARLVDFHMDESHKTPDVLTSATWFLIFEDNGKRHYVETAAIDPQATRRLHALASDEIWAEAQEAADAFHPEIQDAKVPDGAYPGAQQGQRKGRGGKGRGEGGRGRKPRLTEISAPS